MAANETEREMRVILPVQLSAPQLFASREEIDAMDALWSDSGSMLADVWDAPVQMDAFNTDLYNNFQGDMFQQNSGDELCVVHATFEEMPPDMTCYICLDPISEKDRSNVQKLSCNHWFHATCLMPWAMKKNTCPTCRSTHVPSF